MDKKIIWDIVIIALEILIKQLFFNQLENPSAKSENVNLNQDLNDIATHALSETNIRQPNLDNIKTVRNQVPFIVEYLPLPMR